MNEQVIEAVNLTKLYGDAKAVDGVTFSVGRGEIFGLLGPNGAGKTTTILMMLGLTEVSQGTIRVLGLNPQRDPLGVKRLIGYLPDAVGFYDNLTARENLSYTARLVGYDTSAERDSRIYEALARVRLTEVADRRVATFSRGMRQRLGLAEILMKGAEIAILDEPTSGLDPQSTEEFLDMIRALKADNVTVLLSSHLLDRVQRVCDRVALFRDGQVALLGTVTELAGQVLGGGFTVEVEAGGPDMTRYLTSIPGVTQVERPASDRYRLTADRDVRPEAARAVVSAGGELRRLSVDEPSLDAIYARFFQDEPSDRESLDAA